MAVSVIVLNRILIETYGIEGAALATFLVVALFSIIKVIYVKNKLKMQPFTKNTKTTLLIIGLLFAAFYFIQFNIHPLLSILLKSLLLISIFIFLIVKLKLSEDIDSLLRKYFDK